MHVWKYGTQMEQDLDCMLGGEEAWISVLNYISGHCHNMRLSIIMMQNNSICEHSFALTAYR
jgi:hypothetical protein